MTQSLRCLIALAMAWCGVPDSPAAPAWSTMDYGPTLTATLEVAPDNLAYKGLAIRLDEGPGGIAAGSRFMVFDTDTLRMAAAWQGEGFIDWHNIAFDGSHNTHTKIVGQRLFTNPDAPGWSVADDRFSDGRFTGRDGKRYGPLPRSHGRWLGHYLHGNQVVLSYKIDDVLVLEHPGPEGALFTRQFNMGPRSRDLVLQVARRPGQTPRIVETDQGPLALFASAAPLPAKAAGMRFDGSTALFIEHADTVDLRDRDFTIHTRIRTRDNGTLLAQAPKEGGWAPDGKTFFLRHGRPTFDIGWVGAAQARGKVNDGRWHEVAMTYAHEEGTIHFYIDGQPDPANPHHLKAKAPVKNQSLRIGFTSPNFPDPSHFTGEIDEVRLYERALGPEELGNLPSQQQHLVGAWKMSEMAEGRVADRAGRQRTGIVKTGPPDGSQHDRTELAVALVGAPAGAPWMTTPEGDLRVRIPAGKASLQFKILYLGAQKNARGAMEKAMASVTPPASLAPLLEGGPARWTETLTTRPAIIGSRTGPYLVESITTPDRNPYHAWMRLGGFDFFPDGLRAAVCTWQGDVWVVDGLQDPSASFTWRRVASGMFQPLGLKIVKDQIYVTCRDQITRLHDLNNDGETDYYESFNHDAQVTDHFHEFAMDLQTDQAGNFYYAKGACHAKEATVQQHGTLIRVSPDGSVSEIVASGFRAPNGVCVNPDGTFILSDQEGHWTPKNRINFVVPGGFYGYMSGWTDPHRDAEDFIPPVTWIHNAFDRSPAEQLRVASDRWGLERDSILSLSYGTGQILLVMPQQVGKLWQGGVVQMPIAEVPTGVMRGRFHPADGQLYACGLFGWSSNKTRPGGFYRIRYTGKPLHMPVGLEARKEGVQIRFSDKLDPDSAGDPESYAIERFNYQRRASYGSRDFKVSDPNQQGRDDVMITGATLSEDGRSVLLRIPDMQPSMQMEIRYRIRTASGARLAHTIQNTIHALPDETADAHP